MNTNANLIAEGECKTMETESILSAQSTIIMGPKEGRTVHSFGGNIQFKLGPEHTGGAFTVGIGIMPPGGGPPPHRHHNEDELSLILEGRTAIYSNGEWIEVAPGSLVYTPRGVVHTFKNIGDTPSKAWVLTTPCGFESFFEKCSTVFVEAPFGPPDMRRLLSICDEFGIEFVPPIAVPESETVPAHA